MRRLLGDLPASTLSSKYCVVRPRSAVVCVTWCVSCCVCVWIWVFVGTGVGSGSAGVGVAIEGFEALETGWGVGSTDCSWVAAGVGRCAAVESSAAGAFEASGSACEVCASAAGAGVSGAEGVGVGAAGAAPGLRRAALGANFLPVVFSGCDLADLGASPWGYLLLMKELKAAAGLGTALPAAGGWLEPSSADIMVSSCYGQ
jgi:hypothetical protein